MRSRRRSALVGRASLLAKFKAFGRMNRVDLVVDFQIEAELRQKRQFLPNLKTSARFRQTATRANSPEFAPASEQRRSRDTRQRAAARRRAHHKERREACRGTAKAAAQSAAAVAAAVAAANLLVERKQKKRL